MLDVADLRRVAGWALVVGLCISAAVAIVALLTGSWSDTSWRVVGTSLGFSVFTSTAAAGAALRVRPQGWAQVLAVITIGASAAALLTLLVALLDRRRRLDLARVGRRRPRGAVELARVAGAARAALG